MGYGVTRRWCDPVDATAAGSCAERWRFSAEEIISARRSALVEHEQCKKASWLGVKDIHEVNRVDLHPSLVGDMQENFQAMSDDRAVFENVPSTVLQHQVCLCVLFGGLWRKPLEILR